MLFSSLLFLFLFLPVTLILVFLLPSSWRNVLLLIASLVFYAWGCVSYSLLMLFSIAFNYFMARRISVLTAEKARKRVLIVCITGNLAVLVVMKYFGFLIENLNSLRHVFHLASIHAEPILLPAGISFFTFHAISYVVDIYRRESEVQKNPVRLALYISFFPQLIAGPIVRYHDIASQLRKRIITAENFTTGLERFITGLAKKVLFSNAFALPATEIFNTAPEHLNAPLAWFGAVCYALHIYCDFSGYSDMALGLGRMFGFHFLENFNFPYMARSIKDFWRRWHISLSTWFRDYLYVPLGGNRKGNVRTYLNLMLVFFLTGLWHGASWNFVVWGFIHGFFLLIERMFLGKWLERLPGLNNLYTLFIVLNAWVFFSAPDLHYALIYLKTMYGLIPEGTVVKSFHYYLNPEFYFVSLIAILGSAGLFKWIRNQAETLMKGPANLIWTGLRYSLLLTTLVVCSVYLFTDSYNPFIYFRF
ncbi:MAG: MBOAT family O-acyltransferase [Bacteroidia bacterium]